MSVEEESSESKTTERVTPSTMSGPKVPKERYDLRILSSMRRIIRSVDIYSRKLAQDHGVTVPQLLCMLKVDEAGPLTVKELSEAVFLSPSTIVGIVDRLEKHSIFCRERSLTDRRCVRISLSEKGKVMVDQSPSPLQDSLLYSIDNLEELEKVSIALALEKILNMMDPSSSQKDESLVMTEAAPVLESLSDLMESKGVVPKLQ